MTMVDLHPFLVHFPVALLTVSLILELRGTYRRFPELNRAGWWTQLLGTISIAFAVVSGLVAVSESRLASGAQGVLDLHHQMTFASTAIFTVLLLWRISTKTEVLPRIRPAYFFLSALGVVLLMVGSWAGGVLVFEHGVGVSK